MRWFLKLSYLKKKRCLPRIKTLHSSIAQFHKSGYTRDALGQGNVKERLLVAPSSRKGTEYLVDQVIQIAIGGVGVITTERTQAEVLDGTTEETVGSDIGVVLGVRGDTGTE